MVQAKTMATWQTPKTTWDAQEVYSLSPDYDRLCGNTQVVSGQFALCRAAAPAGQLPPLTQSGLVTAEMLNTIENTVADVKAHACPWQESQGKAYTAGGASWQAADVNRLEAALQTAHESLLREETALQCLPFILGGETWD